jgi:pyruvate dehydrogenase E2 component (dihydrolipoamide acetyltransferase)
METGRIGSWLVQVGDRVNRGDVIADIETDKASVEMESVAGGVLVAIEAVAGTELPVGDVIGYLDDEA